MASPGDVRVRLISILIALCAAACSGNPCLEIEPVEATTAVLLPRATHGVVPTNALLWRYSLEEASAPVEPVGDDVSLTDLDWGELEVTPVLDLVGLGVRIEAWRSIEPLRRGAEYEWVSPSPSGGLPLVTTFTVGDTPDTEPPSTPWGAEPTRWSDVTPFDVCGGDATHEARMPTSPPEPLLLALAADAVPGDGGLPDERIDGATDQPGIWLRGYWPLTTQEVRLANIDLAGNVSDWSEPVAVSMPAAGCGAAPETALFLVPLLGLGWRTRRRGVGPRWLPLVLVGLLWAPEALAAGGEGPRPEVADVELSATQLVDLPWDATRRERKAYFSQVPWRQEGSRRMEAFLRGMPWAAGAAHTVLAVGLVGTAHGQPGSVGVVLASLASLPSLGFQALFAGELWRHLREWRISSIERGTVAPAMILSVIGAVLLVPSIATLSADWPGDKGPAFGVMSWGVGLVTAGITGMGLLDDALAPRRVGRAPRPTLFAGPTGVVVRF